MLCKHEGVLTNFRQVNANGFLNAQAWAFRNEKCPLAEASGHEASKL